MAESNKYRMASFEADSKEFDSCFHNFITKEYENGWAYKSCEFDLRGKKRYAYCLFKISKG